MSKNKICRLCLAQPSIYFSLLENNIASMVESLTSIKISPNDTFPTITCYKCLLNIKLAFRIQESMIKSEKRLIELYSSDITIKDEPEEVTVNESFVTKLEENDSNSNETIQICYSNCRICGLQVGDSALTDHIQEHFNNQQKCNLCDVFCNNIEAYRTHFLNNHETMALKCNICDSTFQYQCLYNIHIEKAHMKVSYNKTKKRKQAIVKEYICEICDKTFLERRLYKKHFYNLHEKAKCTVCGIIVTKSNISRHMLTHSSQQQCVCEICGSVARNKESLRSHLFYTHRSTSFPCDKCGEVFRKKYACELHKRKYHTGEKTHICDTCGKPYSSFYDLNKHIKAIHLKLRPYSCDYCDKKFGRRSGLRSHLRQHTNEAPYRCEICGEEFKQNVSLRTHRKSKHNIIEPVTHKCETCGRGFSSDQALKIHMRLH